MDEGVLIKCGALQVLLSGQALILPFPQPLPPILYVITLQGFSLLSRCGR